MFFIGAEGLVLNQFGQVLLIQRDDSRTWALPGGGLDANELPPVGMVREVFEETGFKVHPVRLVKVSYIRGRDLSLLIFLFRGILRGGTATPSAESLQVGFVKTDHLPIMARSHRERLQAGLYHTGGPALLVEQERHPWLWQLVRQLVYRWKDVKRYWHGSPPYQPMRAWMVDTVVLIRNEQGQLLWREGQTGWELPGGPCDRMQAPWVAAATLAEAQIGQAVKIIDLAGVYVTPENLLTFCFVGAINGVTSQGRWATGAEIGEAAASSSHRYLHDTLLPSEITQFHILPSSPPSAPGNQP